MASIKTTSSHHQTDDQIAALEAQLASAHAALREADAQLEQTTALQQRILNALPDSFWFKDSSGRYRLANDAFCAFHHLQVGSVLGHSADELFSAKLAAGMRKGDQAALAHGHLHRGESHVVTADGSEHWIETIKQAIYDDNHTLLGIVGMNRDVTARRSAEEARLSMERTLQEAQRQESLGVLAGGIAHDFNNLLTGILGHAQLALLDLPDSSSAHDNLAQIVVGTQYAAKLAIQLLAYTGKGRILIQATDLNTLVREMAELIRVSLPRSVVVSSELAPRLPLVAGDATQLQQVVLNLLTNAAEALGEAGGQVSLRTSIDTLDSAMLQTLAPRAVLAAGPYVCLEVQDTGIGMNQATLARIFDPFFSTKRTGRGLGLAAVQGIVHSHCGVLQVWSAADQGSRFRLWLPASDAVADASPSALPQEARQGAVLVIDDEPAVRAVACRILQRIGFTTYEAADGEHGLELLLQVRAELVAVLLDLTMPGMGGKATARAIAASYPELPIVLMSGYHAEQIQREHADLRPAGFVPKPFSIDGLRSVLYKAIREKSG